MANSHDAERTARFWSAAKKVLLVVLAFLAGAGLDHYFSYRQDIREEDRWQKSKRARLEIRCDETKGFETPKLSVLNVGDKDAKSVLLLQKYFLISKDMAVYECDLPAFTYLLYNGSKDSMFSMAAGTQRTLAYSPDCIRAFLKKLARKYSGDLVSRWDVTYREEGSLLKEIVRKYFVLFNNNPDYIVDPSAATGGVGMVEKIEEYERLGPPRKLTYVQVFDDYFVNPPTAFYEDTLGVLHFLYPGESPPKRRNSVRVEFPLDVSSIVSSGPNYTAIFWECTDSLGLQRGVITAGSPIY
ncbi:MAG: hypothetical protein E4G91_07050 [Candidatus Zixiibacteriota bacterium]|nr:MAG: hypothetical protein E4G91_07050 [candidate division Zixibacteria bacterium]